LQDVVHPLKRLEDASVLHNHIAVVMTPTKVIRPMIERTVPQFLYMKKIYLRDCQIKNLSPRSLFHAAEKSVAG
jgi:hypothetical protein